MFWIEIDFPEPNTLPLLFDSERSYCGPKGQKLLECETSETFQKRKSLLSSQPASHKWSIEAVDCSTPALKTGIWNTENQILELLQILDAIQKHKIHDQICTLKSFKFMTVQKSLFEDSMMCHMPSSRSKQMVNLFLTRIAFKQLFCFEIIKF